MPSKKTKTTTSAFGSPSRRSHDASPFYAGRLYHDQPQEQEVEFIETVISPELLDRIYSSSAEKMLELPDQSVHLMVTSPPYNVGKEYDGDLSLQEHIAFLERVWSEVYRLLVPGGRACINVANLGRRPYIPLHAWIAASMLRMGFLMRGEVIWNKAASASPSTAWGSWMSATNPTLRDVHEYILIFSKGVFKRDNPHRRENTISNEQFLEYTKSVWTFPAEPATKVGHPAPFPIELPYRLIQLYSFKGEVVLDPFMGSGQTAIAALKADRHFVGYEINPGYVALAQARIQASHQTP
ncbi:MAG TPA: site-specific DNA-methyltransferase [Anaerolineales bacterium]|nr:site-specific DNA-methyltransferase [Anaerolineales bacterium]